MADLPSAEQAGTAAVWFTGQAGITATVLAIVAILEAIFIVWLLLGHRKEHRQSHTMWSGKTDDMQKSWGARIDQFRADVKEAFGQNDDIADKVVDALNKLQIEVARMSARREP